MYRVGDNLAEGIALLDAILQTALSSPPAETITYQNAFLQHTECDPLEATIDKTRSTCIDKGLGVDRSWSDDRDTWLDLLFSELVSAAFGK